MSNNLAKEIAKEIDDLRRAPRKRQIDWTAIILCSLAVAGAVWAVLEFWGDAKLAPYKERSALIEQAQVHLSKDVTDGFKRLNKKMDLLMGATAGVTPKENDLMELNNSFSHD